MPAGHLRKPPQICETRCMPVVPQTLPVDASPQISSGHIRSVPRSLAHAHAVVVSQAGQWYPAPWRRMLGCGEGEDGHHESLGFVCECKGGGRCVHPASPVHSRGILVPMKK